MDQLKWNGVELAAYPSSAQAATIAGWISIGAKAGIGTANINRFVNSIIELDSPRITYASS